MDKVIYTNKTLGLEIVEHTEPVVFQEAEYQGRKVKLGKVQRGGSRSHSEQDIIVIILDQRIKQDIGHVECGQVLML